MSDTTPDFSKTPETYADLLKSYNSLRVFSEKLYKENKWWHEKNESTRDRFDRLNERMMFFARHVVSVQIDDANKSATVVFKDCNGEHHSFTHGGPSGEIAFLWCVDAAKRKFRTIPNLSNLSIN